MPKKAKGKSKKKKSTTRKPARKAVKKKVMKKKTAKKTAKKKILRKKTAKKGLKKKTIKKSVPARRRPAAVKPLIIEPGPPPRTIPPVEEPASNEEAIGTITHYYSHLNVAVVQVNKGTLKIGDTIHIKGHTTDFTQTVDSMEFEHQHVEQATAGQSAGIKVKDHVREHDIVYLVK
jgi:putative protease